MNPFGAAFIVRLSLLSQNFAIGPNNCDKRYKKKRVAGQCYH